jgi:RNA polymerase sigma-70 factor (ECF subfamily)
MTDLEFIRKCVTGKQTFWQDFIDRYARLIYAYILSVLKYKGIVQLSEETIRDIFQEIVFSLVDNNFKRLRSFTARNGSSFASWLRQVVINYTLDYLRKPKLHTSPLEEPDDADNHQDIIYDDSLSISQIAIDKERLEHLKDCIRQLGENEKYFMELHIYRDVCLDKLRKHLRLTRGAIYMQKARIIGKLRNCFKSKGFAFNF